MVSLDTSLKSGAFSLKVLKLINEVILSEKFSKLRPVDPFFISLCFFIDVSSYKQFKIFFWVTCYGENTRVAYVFNLKIS